MKIENAAFNIVQLGWRRFAREHVDIGIAVSGRERINVLSLSASRVVSVKAAVAYRRNSANAVMAPAAAVITRAYSARSGEGGAER